MFRKIYHAKLKFQKQFRDFKRNLPQSAQDDIRIYGKLMHWMAWTGAIPVHYNEGKRRLELLHGPALRHSALSVTLLILRTGISIIGSATDVRIWNDIIHKKTY